MQPEKRTKLKNARLAGATAHPPGLRDWLSQTAGAAAPSGGSAVREVTSVEVNLQSRNKSFRLVVARVLASTRLTITAQYKLYLPPALGRLPETTTEPAGIRP